MTLDLEMDVQDSFFINTVVVDEMIWRLQGIYNQERCEQMSEVIQEKFGIDKNVYDVLEYALTNLEITSGEGTYHYTINGNLLYEGVKLDTLVKFIEFGDLETQGLNYISYIFSYIAANIIKIYSNYLS